MSTGSIAASQHAKVIRGLPKTHVPHNWTPAGQLRVYHDESIVKKKEKKMGWFRKKFLQWSKQAWEDQKAENYSNEIAIKSPDSRADLNATSGVRFTVYPASGGYVIEHLKYDRYKESSSTGLTIVPNGESIGTSIEHIITLESLKS